MNRKKKVLTGAVLVVLGVLVLLTAWSGRLGYVGSHSRDSRNQFEADVKNLLGAVNRNGVDGLKDANFSTWADADNHVNALVLDRDGAVLGRLNDLFFGNATQVSLMVSPYPCQYELTFEVKSTSTTVWGLSGRLALWTDDTGEILATFITEGSTPARGENLAGYRTHFPAINELAVRMATDEWFSFDNYLERAPYDSSNANFPTQAELARAEQYARWQSEQVLVAGENAISLYALSGGRTLAVAYHNDSALNLSEITAWEAQWTQRVVYSCMVLIAVLFILLLALWVFVDARGREFKPALWGVLTLIGNVVAWIVYMMVRPEGQRAMMCPVCGAAVKREYVACPMCAAQLRRSCATCGRALEPEWKACPYCGCAPDA